jgi:hypothetical protein
VSEELRFLLLILAVCVPVGLAIGIVLRKFKPRWCKSYAKACLNRKWWLFALGVVLFATLSVTQFLIGRTSFAVFFLLFAILELFALFAYGFKRLTPEMEKRIDESDPTKLLPFRFWKQRVPANPPDGSDSGEPDEGAE